MENDVRERRAGRGLSQGDLGKLLSVSRQTINAIETGRYLPSLPLAIAAIFVIAPPTGVAMAAFFVALVTIGVALREAPAA